eukprot:g69996.t1
MRERMPNVKAGKQNQRASHQSENQGFVIKGQRNTKIAFADDHKHNVFFLTTLVSPPDPKFLPTRLFFIRINLASHSETFRFCHKTPLRAGPTFKPVSQKHLMNQDLFDVPLGAPYGLIFHRDLRVSTVVANQSAAAWNALPPMQRSRKLLGPAFDSTMPLDKTTSTEVHPGDLLVAVIDTSTGEESATEGWHLGELVSYLQGHRDSIIVFRFRAGSGQSAKQELASPKGRPMFETRPSEPEKSPVRSRSFSVLPSFARKTPNSNLTSPRSPDAIKSTSFPHMPTLGGLTSSGPAYNSQAIKSTSFPHMPSLGGLTSSARSNRAISGSSRVLRRLHKSPSESHVGSPRGQGGQDASDLFGMSGTAGTLAPTFPFQAVAVEDWTGTLSAHLAVTRGQVYTVNSNKFPGWLDCADHMGNVGGVPSNVLRVMPTPLALTSPRPGDTTQQPFFRDPPKPSALPCPGDTTPHSRSLNTSGVTPTDSIDNSQDDSLVANHPLREQNGTHSRSHSQSASRSASRSHSRSSSRSGITAPATPRESRTPLPARLPAIDIVVGSDMAEQEKEKEKEKDVPVSERAKQLQGPWGLLGQSLTELAEDCPDDSDDAHQAADGFFARIVETERALAQLKAAVLARADRHGWFVPVDARVSVPESPRNHMRDRDRARASSAPPATKEPPVWEDDLLANKKQHLLQQLMEGEKQYVRYLKTAVRGYLQPMRAAIADPENKEFNLSYGDLSDIFSNLEDLLANHRDRFLPQLTKALQISGESKMHSTNLGLIFCQHTSFLRDYVTYANNLRHALETLDRLMEEEGFQRLMRHLQEIGQCQALQAYLLLPVDCVPRYGRILSAVLQCVDPRGEDAKDLRKALDWIAKVEQGVQDARDQAAREVAMSSPYGSAAHTPNLSPITPRLKESRDSRESVGSRGSPR